MTIETRVNGHKLVSNNVEMLFEDIENLLKGKDCNQCKGRGAYLVANGEDDQDWEHCQH